MIDKAQLVGVADQIARALCFVREGVDRAPMIVTPLLYPGGSSIVLTIHWTLAGYCVSDGGVSEHEADAMGMLAGFPRHARDAARRHGVVFRDGLLLDEDLTIEELPGAAIAVANAAKMAVEDANKTRADYRFQEEDIHLWAALEKVFSAASIRKNMKMKGREAPWTFTAMVEDHGRATLFDLVRPHRTSVEAAIVKFLDIGALGARSPARVAVMIDRANTPLTGALARTATLLDLASEPALFRAAA